MPITTELENIKKFESVGFSHKQAEVLAEVHEATAQDSNRELKEFIHAEIKEVHSEIKASQSDLLIKIFGIIVGSLSIAVAIIKLTP